MQDEDLMSDQSIIRLIEIPLLPEWNNCRNCAVPQRWLVRVRRLVQVRVNGQQYERSVEPRRSLADFLRDDLELTGTKKGCETGDCGACSVIWNGMLVNSCLVLAVEVNGGEVATVEGLAGGAGLDPVQEAFVQEGGLQCGFCTPGMLLATRALLDERPEPTVDEIRQGLLGNICRCTGYAHIIRAVQAAARLRRAHASAAGEVQP